MNTKPDTEKKTRTATPAHLGWRLLALTYDSIPAIGLLMITSGLFVLARGGRTVEHSPLFAALLSAAFLGETPRAYHAAAFVLIVGGIVVSSRR